MGIASSLRLGSEDTERGMEAATPLWDFALRSFGSFVVPRSVVGSFADTSEEPIEDGAKVPVSQAFLRPSPQVVIHTYRSSKNLEPTDLKTGCRLTLENEACTPVIRSSPWTSKHAHLGT